MDKNEESLILEDGQIKHGNVTITVETKVNIGDVVYILYENNILKGTVGKIQFNILEHKPYKYWIPIKNELGNWVGATKEFPEYPEFFEETQVFLTKAELLKSL